VIVSQSRRRAAGGGGRNPFDNFEHVGISNLNATVRLLRFCKDNESMVDIEDLILENLRHVRTAVDGLRDDMREVKIRRGHLEIALIGAIERLANGMMCMLSSTTGIPPYRVQQRAGTPVASATSFRSLRYHGAFAA
jgi:hypothetical protein